jgi:hypothetical protein
MPVFKTVAAATLAAAFLSGCVSDETASARRASLIEQVFPDPLDRQGIYLAFPLESGGGLGKLEIVWLRDQVTEAEILRRVAGACARRPVAGYTGQAGISKDIGSQSMQTDQGLRTVRQVFFSCLTA